MAIKVTQCDCGSVRFITSSMTWTKRRRGLLSSRVDIHFAGTCAACGRRVSAVSARNVPADTDPRQYRIPNR